MGVCPSTDMWRGASGNSLIWLIKRACQRHLGWNSSSYLVGAQKSSLGMLSLLLLFENIKNISMYLMYLIVRTLKLKRLQSHDGSRRGEHGKQHP